MRTLVAGWFSFPEMGATAGDLLARDLVCRWLREAGISYDVATAPPFPDGVALDSLDPARYTHVVFVCGPFGNGPPITSFLERVRHCRLIGINLTMLQGLGEWNPFALLLERDSDRAARPDLVFIADAPAAPVAATIQVHLQKEYGPRALHMAADAAIDRLFAARSVARVRIDTRLDSNQWGLRTPAEVDSLIRRMDLIVTTRLHGLVLGLRAGIPVIAIDPIAGGAKVSRQAQAIGWPLIIRSDEISDQALLAAFDYCLTEKARQEVADVRLRASQQLSTVRMEFLTEMQSHPRQAGA